MRLFVLTRHGETTYNVERRCNGDPAVSVPLTERGRDEARRLGSQVANVHLELCVHSRFGRTLETGTIALDGRGVPLVVEPLLDDVDVGEFEGRDLDAYRTWKEAHSRATPFPGGESLDDAARRYARGLARLLERPEPSILVVTHEIPVRYALNAARGSDELDGPLHDVANATPYLFDESALASAAAGIERLTQIRPGA